MKIIEEPPPLPPDAAACEAVGRASPGAGLSGLSEGIVVSADAAGAEGVAVELRLRMTLLRLCPAPALNVWV